MGCLAFGALLGVVCLVSGIIVVGIIMIVIFWSIAAGVLMKYFAEEYLSEGDDLIIDVCKCAPASKLKQPCLLPVIFHA